MKWRVIDITIDEAIAHARAVAKHKRKKLDECNKKNNYACKFCIEIRTCKEVAEENEQIAEWFEELKVLRRGANELRNAGYEHGHYVGYNKALDDFVKMAYEELLYSDGLSEIDIDYIAEHLKAGGENEQGI